MEFIQIGVTALRDPVTGDFLPAIPLYVNKENAEGIAEPLGYNLRELGKEFERYRRQARKLEEEGKARKRAATRKGKGYEHDAGGSGNEEPRARADHG